MLGGVSPSKTPRGHLPGGTQRQGINNGRKIKNEIKGIFFFFFFFLKKERKSKEKCKISTNEIFRDFPLYEFEFSGKLTNQIRKKSQKKVECAASGGGVPTSARCAAGFKSRNGEFTENRGAGLTN